MSTIVNYFTIASNAIVKIYDAKYCDLSIDYFKPYQMYHTEHKYNTIVKVFDINNHKETENNIVYDMFFKM